MEGVRNASIHGDEEFRRIANSESRTQSQERIDTSQAETMVTLIVLATNDYSVQINHTERV
jgi:hypothetical protein